MNAGYGPLARVYDRLNSDIDYKTWADFIEACFTRFGGSRPGIVLDLACGTGKMTYELAGRGYDMIGIDGSADMLCEAASRRSAPDNPLFLMQDMREFELYGSVGAVVCCLDGINYLCGEGDLAACFGRVRNYLDYGGVFVFDVNTPYKFKNVFADNAYILEDECGGGNTDGAVFCGWQNSFDAESGICNFYLTIFEDNGDGTYSRSDEEQTERCYSLEALRTALEFAGLEYCGIFGDFDFCAPSNECERWYVVARRSPKP